MRKFTLLFLFTALFTIIGHSQVTYVPDDNFEQVLIDLGYDSGTLNDYVPTINISSVTILNVDDKGITDLTGIEDFTALTELRCYTNTISNLDVSANTQLIYLHCSANSLTSLDVSNNSQLQFLNCSINSISSLNLNQNALLSNFDASNNLLTAISIKNGTGNIITNFNTINNPNLTCIQVDNATYSTNNWTDIDVQTSFSEDCHYGETYVPDDNFEQALIDLGYDTGVLDDYVPTANIDIVTSLEVNNKSISDLTGIEDFVSLSVLRCQNNNLTSLDISNNISLTELQCKDNNLTNLDVSNNTALIYLFCSTNNLTSLDVSNNTSLLYLYCHTNNLTSLNLNTSITQLYCYTNNLSSLNLANVTSLQILSCYDNELTGINLKNGNNTSIVVFDATSNPSLTCIQVEDATYSSNNWALIDAQTSFNEDCHYGETYVPDDNFEQALIDLGYDTGALDDYVPTANINTISNLNINSKNISDLTGIEDFELLATLACLNNNLTTLNFTNNTYLNILLCSSNTLTSLNLTNNAVLENLACQNNNLTNIDVSNNILLETLNCQVNDLTGLDLSNNVLLKNLYAQNNDLTSLNIKNGNNTIITNFTVIGNANLTCIEVDDVSYSMANWTNIDAQSGFATNCSNLTNIPDDNFEQALIDLGYDFGPLDDYVFTSNINTLTSLDVTNKSISDLTGIEDFIALTLLVCSDNNLSSIDISSNTVLTHLYCNNNSLTTLDISNNAALSQLHCSSNSLSSLDVSNNSALFILYCFGNNLSSLDVSNNSILSLLSCYGNNLSSLDVSNNTSLTYLTCASNSLVSLNVKNGNNTNFNFFSATSNPNLTCIEVDDATYSTTNWTNVNPTSGFSEDCHYDETYVPDDNFEQALIDLGYDTGVLDDYVPTANINIVASLNVDNKNISDLTGIEGFVALTYLGCTFNSLTSIDLSNNTLLDTLYCSNNTLTSLDLSNNTLLETLTSSFNPLTSMDLSNNTLLKTLYCQGNSLTSLDVSNNTALLIIRCNTNNLTSLNIKNGNNTSILDFEATGNPNLTCIEVDDATYSTTNWTTIDAQSGFATNCTDTTYVPDDNFEQALIDLGLDFGPLDDFVFTANINAVTSLNVDNKNISDLTGIEGFVALTYLGCTFNSLTSIDLSNNALLDTLYCSNNTLTSIDISNNTLLETLTSSYNPLTSMDLSNNTLLKTLYCQGNSLTSLDVSNNTALLIIRCNTNNLTSLNIKNGNNTSILDFEATGNPNLTCIEVDDAAYSTTNWTTIDVTTSFSEDCSTTLSTDTLNAQTFSFYPNPVNDKLIISAQINGRFSILNVNGQILKQGVLINGNNTIDMSQLQAGLYFLNIKADSSSMLKKIIKK